MRFLILISLALAALSALSAEPTVYPLWNGHETIAEYAKKAGLAPTKTLDLGGGVKLELVLIPAGEFIMGTEEPRLDEEHFITQIGIGQLALAISAGVEFVMLAFVISRAVREKHRPQVSLARLLALAIVAGVGLLGGLHWFYTAHAQSEYQVALARFKKSYEMETPAHEVTLTNPYFLGKFEVTQEQYEQVMGSNPSHFKGRDLPVQMVSWNDAQEFCKRTSVKTGWVVRLPTEAEWEHACRAGTKTTYSLGDAVTDLDRAGWWEENSGGKTHPVGQKQPNAWDVHDMHGNVFEWCSDWCGDYGAEATTNPQGPARSSTRVFRGGSLVSLSVDCRSATRFEGGPDGSTDCDGFRVVVPTPRTH